MYCKKKFYGIKCLHNHLKDSAFQTHKTGRYLVNDYN